MSVWIGLAGHTTNAVCPHLCYRRRDRRTPAPWAVRQEANDRSRRLLESIGMIQVDSFVEFGAAQVMYSLDRAVAPRMTPRILLGELTSVPLNLLAGNRSCPPKPSP